MARTILLLVCLFNFVHYNFGQDSKKIGETTLSEEAYSNKHKLTATINNNSFVVIVKTDDKKGFLVCYNKLVEEQWKVPLGDTKNKDGFPFYLPKENKVLVFFQSKNGGKYRLEAQYFNPKDGTESGTQLLITQAKRALNIFPSSDQTHFLASDYDGRIGSRSNNYVIKSSLEIVYSKSLENDDFIEEDFKVSNKGELLVAGRTKDGDVILDLHDASSRKTLLTIPAPLDKKNYFTLGKIEENNQSYYIPVFEETKKVGVLQMMIAVYDSKQNNNKLIKSDYFLPSYLNNIVVEDFRGTKPIYSEKGYLNYKGVLGLKPFKIIFDDDSFYVISELLNDGKNGRIEEVPNDRNYNYSNLPFIKAKEVLISAFSGDKNTWNKLIYRFGYQEVRKTVEKGEEAVSSSFLLNKERLMFIIPDQDEHVKQNCLFGALNKKNGDLIFRERFFHTKRDHLVSKNILAWLSPTNVVLFNCSPDAKTTFFLTSFDFSDYLEW